MELGRSPDEPIERADLPSAFADALAIHMAIDPDGLVLYAARSILNHLRANADDVIGRHLTDLLPTTWHAPVQDLLGEAAAEPAHPHHCLLELSKALVPTELHADAHAAGLLHDLGWLALAVTRPDLADDVTHWLTHGEAPPGLHPSHADVGAYLLDLWGLPETIVEAVALHHSPCAGAHRPVAHALQIAVALHLPSTDRTHPCLDPNHLDAHGLTDAVAAARPLTTTTIP